MKIHLLAVGQKMPAWVQAGCDEYRKRLPPDFAVDLKELPLAPRAKNTSAQTAIEREGEQLLAAIPARSFVIALDSRGKQWSTEQLAAELAQWRERGQTLVMVIGGPDGLSAACRTRADVIWSLSALTLPHPLVRVVLYEQLYRVWSVMNRHPYHK